MSRPPVGRLNIDLDELLAIIEQARHRPLRDEEAVKLSAAIETLGWLTGELEAQKTSARRLYRMLFGPSSEKTSVVFPQQEDDGEAAEAEQTGARETDAGNAEDASEHSDEDTDKGNDKRKGHGRNPAAAYRGADKICVDHESLKPGDLCPACGQGKVYRQQRPKVLVRVTGGAPLGAKVYELSRLRCNLCGEVFTARAPPDAGRKKYDETAAATIALLRYGSGLPFNRLQRLQASVGIPLPASTQWDVVHSAAPAVLPAYNELIRQAAQGELFHNDDTKMPVLALTGKRRATEAPDDDPPERTGMFTTGIVSVVEGRRIALFFTGRQHAGENLTDVLKHRTAELASPIQMCDGLSRNVPEAFATILANCLSHARRYFVDVADNFPAECRYVLETLAELFRNDAIARKRQMSAKQRLAFHQAHSGPLMDELKNWFDTQFKERKVEPNSGLGQAFSYMLKRYSELTLFLRQPGAPLSNNVVERALKRAIVHRKNSLFYRSLDGARVGDIFMSLIHTAELCGTDPLDYLVALQQHAEQVANAPGAWMPWNYQATRAELIDEAAGAAVA